MDDLWQNSVSSGINLAKYDDIKFMVKGKNSSDKSSRKILKATPQVVIMTPTRKLVTIYLQRGYEVLRRI